MLRSQRMLLTFGLPLLAWLLHANLCEWMFKEERHRSIQGGVSTYVQNIIWAWEHEPPPNVRVSLYTGLATDVRVDPADAVVFGIALPLALLMLMMYLWLGWRRAARRARGLCAACGYDLRGAAQPGAACPECGDQSS